MANKKSTKRALMLSALSLLLCVSMFVGTTFAWFTDSVSTVNNKIVAGNLDVELEYAKVTDGQLSAWASVEGQDDIFDPDALWEPGRVEVVYLKVSNLGSLALKYQLSVNVYNEIAGENVAGKEFKLSDHLVFKAVDMPDALATYADRDAAVAAAGTAKGLKSYNGNTTTLDVDGVDYVALIVYMPESVGNEANYRGDKVPTIELGVNLYATQVEAENDSFGNDYDKDSAIFVSGSTAAEASAALKAAIANVKDGGTVFVNDGDYYIDGQLSIVGKSVNIVGVGENAVIHMTDTRVNYNKFFYIYGSPNEGEDVTVNISNVTLVAEVPTKSDIWVRTDAPNGAKVSGDVTVNLDNVTCTSIICDNNYVNGDTVNLNITNSKVQRVALDASPFNGNGLNTYTNLNYTNSRLDSITINPAVNDLTHIKINGVNPTAPGEQQTQKYISTAEELLALGGAKINGTYVLMSDLDMSGYEMKPIQVMNNDALVFNGNGHTISNIKIVAAGANGMTGAGNEVAGLFDVTANASSDLTVNNLTIKNASVACSGYAATIVGYANSSTDVIMLNNVDVIGATITSDSVAALVGYTVGPVTLTDCDVSGLALTGEAGRPEKVGALVGTANTATSVVTVLNCAKDADYNYAGRVINGATMTIDGVVYVTNAAGLASAVANGATNILLADGEYDVYGCGGKTLTISGTKDAVIKIMNEGEDGCDYGFDGATVTFNGVTFNTTANNGNYKGFARMTATFNDCAFFGAYTTHMVQTFNDCTFDFNNGYLWIWGATEVSFNGCEFGGNSKAILAHGGANTVITINNCVFAATEKGYTGAGDNTAAVEIDPTGTNTYTIKFTGENTITNSYAGWTRVKDGSTGHTITGVN